MSDIVISRLQLEAWATAVKSALGADDCYSPLSERDSLALHQALEDMTDELADPDEIDIIDDAEMYDPDEVSDGWEPEDTLSELDDPDFRPTYF